MKIELSRKETNNLFTAIENMEEKSKKEMEALLKSLYDDVMLTIKVDEDRDVAVFEIHEKVFPELLKMFITDIEIVKMSSSICKLFEEKLYN